MNILISFGLVGDVNAKSDSNVGYFPQDHHASFMKPYMGVPISGKRCTSRILRKSNNYIYYSNSKPFAESNRIGSAAIESITSFLAPILPFTGGRDFRRDAWDRYYSFSNWMNGPFHSSRPSKQAGDSPEIETSSRSILKKVKISVTSHRHPVMGADVFEFFPNSEVAKLSLTDVSDIFHYAVLSNRQQPNKNTNLVENMSNHATKAISAIEKALEVSRGEGFLPALTSSNFELFDDVATHEWLGSKLSNTKVDAIVVDERGNWGDLDAFQFCAIMRIFAEWRIVRQVPEGYKGYSVGMNLGLKDVVQNLAKIEAAAYAWMKRRKEMQENHEVSFNESGSSEQTDMVLRSPTLRQVLKDEVDHNFHSGKLPVLKDPSAAMGLLWVRRQLWYQSLIYLNLIKDSSDARAAVQNAYNGVYNRYHGWAVQQIFSFSFKAAPHVTEIYKHMNHELLNSAAEEARLKVEGENASSSKSDFQTNSDKIQGEFDVYKDHEFESIRPTLPEINSYDINSLQKRGGGSDEIDMAADNTNLHDLPPGKRDKEKKNHSASGFDQFLNQVVLEWDKVVKNTVTEWDKFAKNMSMEWDKLAKNTSSEWEKITKNTVNEWHKIWGSVLKLVNLKEKDGQRLNDSCINNNEESRENIHFMSSQDIESRVVNESELLRYIEEKMLSAAIEQMAAFLRISVPLLVDTQGLIDEFNMDDPTKV
mmetsp:Transcript_41571/g.97290  ORF Transcript_41571/g.97290 Transcript_41571/m.97290 type:complete len:705 (+) Transcript_41571:1240-3354(+)